VSAKNPLTLSKLDKERDRERRETEKCEAEVRAHTWWRGTEISSRFENSQTVPAPPSGVGKLEGDHITLTSQKDKRH
jgi:hypothetical protein